MWLCLIFCDSPHVLQECLCPTWVITWAQTWIISKSSFNIQHHTQFLFTDSTHIVKQLKSQSAKQYLLGFNILYFVKVQHAEQGMGGWKHLFKDYETEHGQRQWHTNCSAKILPAPPHAKTPGTSIFQPVFELCNSVKSYCLQSCSRNFSGLIWDTLTCCLRRSRFSCHLLVHLLHQYFNTSAQLYFSTWISKHSISSDEKSSCKVLNSCQTVMWTQLSLRGTKPAFF